jgi:hypothetical protein
MNRGEGRNIRTEGRYIPQRRNNRSLGLVRLQGLGRALRTGMATFEGVQQMYGETPQEIAMTLEVSVDDLYRELAVALGVSIANIKDAFGDAEQIPNMGNKNILEGVQNAISFNNIQTGNTLVNFRNNASNMFESNYGRYYKENTINQLMGRHPFTRKPITEKRKYTARVVPVASNHVNTRKSRKARKSRKSRR